MTLTELLEQNPLSLLTALDPFGPLQPVPDIFLQLLHALELADPGRQLVVYLWQFPLLHPIDGDPIPPSFHLLTLTLTAVELPGLTWLLAGGL